MDPDVIGFLLTTGITIMIAITLVYKSKQEIMFLSDFDHFENSLASYKQILAKVSSPVRNFNNHSLKTWYLKNCWNIARALPVVYSQINYLSSKPLVMFFWSGVFLRAHFWDDMKIPMAKRKPLTSWPTNNEFGLPVFRYHVNSHWIFHSLIYKTTLKLIIIIWISHLTVGIW